jgi:secreted trypsin-like serine protease
VVETNTWCRRHTYSFEPKSEFCAIDPRHRVTACTGDSGAPFLLAGGREQRPTDVGVLIRAVAGCSPRRPVIFTRMSALLTWLSEVSR